MSTKISEISTQMEGNKGIPVSQSFVSLLHECQKPAILYRYLLTKKQLFLPSLTFGNSNRGCMCYIRLWLVVTSVIEQQALLKKLGMFKSAKQAKKAFKMSQRQAKRNGLLDTSEQILQTAQYLTAPSQALSGKAGFSRVLSPITMIRSPAQVEAGL